VRENLPTWPSRPGFVIYLSVSKFRRENSEFHEMDGCYEANVTNECRQYDVPSKSFDEPPFDIFWKRKARCA
jgi:hypothetical protein